ncbi:phage distal tail protein, partial [Halalkalibacterium ligniniphilum]
GDPIEPHRWQGPSLKRAIGYSLQDFQADIKVENLNVDFEVGMIEIYLLDANNNTVAKIGIEDVWRGTEQMIAKSQLGGTNGKWVFQEFPSIGNETGWNNFNGLLRISRVGRQWEMYVARFSPSGIHLTRRYFSFNDVAGSYMVPITQIQVATRSFPLRVPTEMRVKEIKIFRINQPQPVQEIPLAVQPGDVIEINTETSNLLLNGESRVDLYELSTDFFEIEQGINSYELYPKGIADVEVRYRRKWL